MVLPRLILLAIAIVLLWCLVDWLWDLLLHGDIVDPSHRADWGLRSFAVAGPSSWNALPVGLRSSSFGLDTFAKHLKTHLFGLAYSRQDTHFEFVLHFVRCDTVRVSPNQIIIIIIIIILFFYYYYYIYLLLLLLLLLLFKGRTLQFKHFIQVWKVHYFMIMYH